MRLGVAGFEDLASAAVAFLEALACQRAGGLETRVRTQARCGGADTYAFSMIGESSQCYRLPEPQPSSCLPPFCSIGYQSRCKEAMARQDG